MSQTLHICMLNADIPVPNVIPVHPTYGSIFASLLSTAAAKLSPSIKITSTDFDVIQGQYPTSLANIDAIIISGSANSAYDNLPWIRRLDLYIHNVYTNHPHVKIFGSCFGHQIISQSLLGPHGASVEPDPQGWEIGVQKVRLDDAFRQTFSKKKSAKLFEGDEIPESLRLQFVHHDHVVLPPSGCMPPDWVTLGSTGHCAVQGVYEPGRVLTYQGHFEFDRFVNAETIKFFFPMWEPEVMQEALRAIDKEDDAEAAARMVVLFLLEEEERQGGRERCSVAPADGRVRDISAERGLFLQSVMTMDTSCTTST